MSDMIMVGTHLFVGLGGGTLDVIDTVAKKVVASITVAESFYDMSFDGAHTIWFAGDTFIYPVDIAVPAVPVVGAGIEL